MEIDLRVLKYMVERFGVMGKKIERQKEKYKIWLMAVLLTCVCISLYYFHVILRIGTIITHIFYVPIILASIWWKRKGLVVALFSSGFLIVSHVFLRPDMASHNDYFRALMFIVTACLVAELSRRIAKEQDALRAANQQLRAGEQQLKAVNQQLRANEQQLVGEITERKSTEERVREQGEFLRNVIESLGHPFYVIDANDNTIKMANLAALQGKLPEKITCYMLSHKKNKPCSGADHPCPLEDVKKTKQPVIVEHIHYDKDGNNRNIEVHAYPIFDKEQNVTQIIEYCLDITERKKAEEKLQESELKFKTIFENAGGAIFIADSKTGKILECNSQAEQLLGRPRAEIIEMHQSELHPRGEEEKYKEKFAAHVQKGHVVDYEGEVQHRDGRRTPVWIAAQCLKIGGKDVIMGLFVDTTEHKKAEKRLLDHQEKLKSLASQLSLIEERERHRLATELHDQIGQSLVMSKMKLDSLCESMPSGLSREVLEEICACLGNVIENTRTLTFDLSSPILYELGFETAVSELLDEQIREKHGIETEFRDDGQPKPLDDDIRTLLFRNVRELLINVVKHAKAQKVKVSVSKVDEHICVIIEDDGVGFETAKIGSNTGFGIFSIRQRLEQLAGHLEIESEPGRGSRFTMTAPLKVEKNTEGVKV